MLQETRPSAPQGRTTKPVYREDPILCTTYDRMIDSGVLNNPVVEIERVSEKEIQESQRTLAPHHLRVRITFRNPNKRHDVRVINPSVPGCGPLRAAAETTQVTCDISPSRPRDFVICHGKTMHVVTVRCEVVKLMNEDRVCERVFRLITSVRTTRNRCCVTEQYPIAHA